MDSTHNSINKRSIENIPGSSNQPIIRTPSKLVQPTKTKSQFIPLIRSADAIGADDRSLQIGSSTNSKILQIKNSANSNGNNDALHKIKGGIERGKRKKIEEIPTTSIHQSTNITDFTSLQQQSPVSKNFTANQIADTQRQHSLNTTTRIGGKQKHLPSTNNYIITKQHLQPTFFPQQHQSITNNSAGISSIGEKEMILLKKRLDELEKQQQKITTAATNLSADNSNLNLNVQQHQQHQRELDEIHHTKSILEQRITQLKEENDKFIHQISTLNHQICELGLEKEAQLIHANKLHQIQSESLLQSIDALKAKSTQLADELTHLNNENSLLKEKIRVFSLNILQLENQCTTLQSTISNNVREINGEREENRRLKDMLLLVGQKNSELEGKLIEAESLRRRLFNQVQELKGNIRVFCRIKPALTNEHESAITSTLLNNTQLSKINQTDDGCGLEIVQSQEGPMGNLQSKSFTFTFDRVFNETATQKTVFDEVSQLVQSSLDGYRVCIFAYGQTGSGKTYTMEGLLPTTTGSYDENFTVGDGGGIIPRSVNKIFQTIHQLELLGWKYTLEGSFLEIYNETIRDLLLVNNNQSIINNNSYEIRHVNGKTTVSDLTLVSLVDSSNLLELLKRASRNRAVGETQCNERSSRSHSVFTLRLIGKNAITNEECDGLLNLVDLAGSERLSLSGSTGDRLKETQAINKSLSSLGDVIAAIANKEQHIPYRNSKLTYLLQNSLGGNSKTLMFVNISSQPIHQQETLCSLRFATKVNSCQIGTAKRSIK